MYYFLLFVFQTIYCNIELAAQGNHGYIGIPYILIGIKKNKKENQITSKSLMIMNFERERER